MTTAPLPAPIPDPPSREDIRKHLDLIQAVISRMSAASSNSKSWMLPVIVASYGYALAQHVSSVALLGVGAAVLFGYMDLTYLYTERLYVSLYKSVQAQDGVYSLFSLTPERKPLVDRFKQWREWTVRSWSILPFYLPIILVGVGIAIWSGETQPPLADIPTTP